MFVAGMSNEQLVEQLRVQAMEMAQIKAAMDSLHAQQQATFGGAQGGTGLGTGGKGDGKGFGKRVILDTKYFQRVDKFEGNPAKFKSWIFDLLTQIGSIDSELAKDLRTLLKDRPKLTVDKRGVFEFGDFEDENHNKYKVNYML